MLYLKSYKHTNPIISTVLKGKSLPSFYRDFLAGHIGCIGVLSGADLATIEAGMAKVNLTGTIGDSSNIDSAIVILDTVYDDGNLAFINSDTKGVDQLNRNPDGTFAEGTRVVIKEISTGLVLVVVEIEKAKTN